MLRTLSLLTALHLVGSLLVVTVDAGVVLSGLTAATSSDFIFTGGDPHEAADVVRESDLNASNQHLTGNFVTGDNSWLSANNTTTSDQWVYVDLGSAFDLERVNIWNYHEFFETTDTSGRSVKGYAMYVAGAGATLPSAQTATPFSTGGGWTLVSQGDFAKGPNTTTANVPLPRTDTVTLSNTGVRYVGIDIESLHGPAPVPFSNGAVGLAQIQVVAVPEPSIFSLFSLLGCLCVGWNFWAWLSKRQLCASLFRSLQW